MTMVRMFHIACDSCNRDVEQDEWYANLAVENAKTEGWHLRNYTAICDECWDDGVRFKNVAEKVA